MAFGKSTHQTTAYSSEMRESLLSIMRDVSPNEDNYFTSNLAVGAPAINPIHSWNLFNESRNASVSSKIEGATTTYADLTMETRSSNRTMILEEAVRVSRTKASIATVTGEDTMGKEKERALRRLKSQMEYALVNGVLASGASGVAREAVGIDGAISTNVTARTSGQSFTETELNDIVQDSWDTVGSEFVCDLLAAPVVIKRRISGFTSNLTRNITADEKRLVNEIRVYDSQVGQRLAIIAHKDINAAAGTLTVLALREELFNISFLIDSGEPHWEERAKDGDRENGVYITELTLASLNQRSSVKRTGYATTL